VVTMAEYEALSRQIEAASAEFAVAERELARAVPSSTGRVTEARLASLEENLASLHRKIDRLVSPPPTPPRRSQMSAKQKSTAIDRMGLAAYQRLPW